MMILLEDVWDDVSQMLTMVKLMLASSPTPHFAKVNGVYLSNRRGLKW